MTTEPNSQDRMRATLVIVATIATIAFNALAATGYAGGVKPEAISDKYPTVLTPAGYVFTIWIVIYLGMAAFSIYQLLPGNLARFRPIRSLYIFSCVLNCAWVYFWQRDGIGICLALIVVLLVTLLAIYVKLHGCRSFAETWLMQSPFGLYLGWVAALVFINFVVFLAALGVKMSDAAGNALGSVLIMVAAISAVIVRVKLRNFFYPLALAWVLTAIAVKQGGHTVIVVSAAIGVVICLVTTGSFVVNLRDSTSG